MSARFTITVEGVDDESVVGTIEQAICQSFHDMALPGSWRVLVRPSPVTGRWDFTLFGLDVRHKLSIAAPPPLLCNLIPQRMRETLDRLARHSSVTVPIFYGEDLRPV